MNYVDYFLQGFFLRKEIIQVLKCLSKHFNEGNLAKEMCIHAFIKTNVTNCKVEILKIQLYHL